MTLDALRDARDRLEQQQFEQALESLLEAWRARRDARVASLIDAIEELVPREDGRWPQLQALAVWPATWQAALHQVQPLLLGPLDPRVAKRFALEVCKPRYPLGSAARLYRPMLDAIARIGDTRCSEILASIQLGALSKPYVTAIRASLQRTCRALENVPYRNPDQAELRAIETIERLLSGQGALRAHKERAARDLLDAVYDDLEDDERRALYADYLLLQGDPRGELFMLQLSKGGLRAQDSDTDAAGLEAREQALLERYGRVWAGALGPYFERQLVFDRGLFAGGLLHPTLPPTQLRAAREWRALRYVDLGASQADPSEVFALELRTLLGVPGRQLGALLAAPCARTLVELGVRDLQQVSELELRSLLDGEALPALRKLHLSSELVGRLRHSRLLARLEEVVTDYVQPWAELPRAEAPALSKVHVWLAPSYQRASWSFHVTLLPAGGGAVQAKLDPKAPASSDALEGLLGFIGLLPPSFLRALQLEPSPRLELVPFHVRARLNAALVGRSSLEQLSTPWPDVQRNPRIELTRRRALTLQCWGPSLLDGERLPLALQALWALDPTAQQLVLPDGSVQALPLDPLAACSRAAKAASSLTLLRDAFDGPSFTLTRERATPLAAAQLSIALQHEPDLSRAIDWLFAWAERLGLLHARILPSAQDSEPLPRHAELFLHAYEHSLFVGAPKLFLGSQLAPFLADAELPAPYVATRRGALLLLDRGALGERLERDPLEQVKRGFERALPQVFARKWGYQPEQLLRAIVGPALAPRGLLPTFTQTIDRQWQLSLGEDVCFSLRVLDPIQAPRLAGALACRIGAGASEPLHPRGAPPSFPAATHADAERALRTMASLADAAYARIERSWTY